MPEAQRLQKLIYLYLFTISSSSSKYEPSLSTRLIGSECVCDLWSVSVQETTGKFWLGACS